MPSQMRLALSLFGVLVATAPASAAEISENSLRAADAEQMRIIVEGDAKAQSEFMHDRAADGASWRARQASSTLRATEARPPRSSSGPGSQGENQ
jgi:hypothetical protein